MNKLLEIRKEYDEPFVEVVKGYAEMGYSRAATARVLGFDPANFHRVCTRFQLHPYFKPRVELRDDCTPKGKGWVKGKKRNRGNQYTEAELLAEVQRWPTTTLFMRHSLISLSTIIRRFGTFKKARAAILPDYKARPHPWSRHK
jgi:hypothetical protein